MLNGISQRSKKGLKRDRPEQSGTVTEPERTEPARGRGHSENIKSKAWHRAGEVSIRKLPSETLRGYPPSNGRQAMAEGTGRGQPFPIVQLLRNFFPECDRALGGRGRSGGLFIITIHLTRDSLLPIPQNSLHNRQLVSVTVSVGSALSHGIKGHRCNVLKPVSRLLGNPIDRRTVD